MTVKKLILSLICTAIADITFPRQMLASNRIFTEDIQSLQTTVGRDWLSPPVITLSDITRGKKHIVISFDEMSHDYRRLIYRIERHEADWKPSEELFESDWLVGFNDNPIEDFTKSINTTFLYTHYNIKIPNDKCQLTMSGNYRVSVYDADNPDELLLETDFMIVENTARLSLESTTNTDIDINKSHQQLTMRLDYGSLNVADPQEQLITIVKQNNRDDNMRWNVKPNITMGNSLIWQHNRELIFDGGNEYHKFETLDLSHPTMGIDHISWDGSAFNVYPFVSEPRRNYSYDEGANGAFCIRNSEYTDIDYTCDYAWIHYTLKTGRQLEGEIFIDGWWTTSDNRSKYIMHYDSQDKSYHLKLLQKQGHYSYQFLQLMPDGSINIPECEGNFHETENTYQAYTYYRQQGGRTWLLVAYCGIEFAPASSIRH